MGILRASLSVPLSNQLSALPLLHSKNPPCHIPPCNIMVCVCSLHPAIIPHFTICSSRCQSQLTILNPHECSSNLQCCLLAAHPAPLNNKSAVVSSERGSYAQVIGQLQGSRAPARSAMKHTKMQFITVNSTPRNTNSTPRNPSHNQTLENNTRPPCVHLSLSQLTTSQAVVCPH